MIHYAKIESSPRLQRLLGVLQTGRPYTTREIIEHADICAVNTAVAELRKNGYDIECTPLTKGIYAYTLRK